MEVAAQLLPAVLVLGLLALALWILRRGKTLNLRFRRQDRPEGVLCPIERLTLAPQHTLHLVRVGRRVILIANSPSGSSLLDAMPWEDLETEQLPEGPADGAPR